MIYIVSPVDNPVASMSKNVKASNRIHGWTEDVLAAAAANRQVEGADAGADASEAVVERSGNMQIMTHTVEISATLEEIEKYGRSSEVEYQLAKGYSWLANCEELAIMGSPGGTRQTGAAGDGSTARQLTSFHNQLDAGVIEDATAAATTDAVEAHMLNAHLATYNEGGNPGMAVCNPALGLYFSSFANSSKRYRDVASDREIVNVIDRYASPYGEFDVVLDRGADANIIALIDFEYSATPILRPTADKALPENGDYHRRFIFREAGYAVLNSKAHAMVDNIPADLAPAA